MAQLPVVLHKIAATSTLRSRGASEDRRASVKNIWGGLGLRVGLRVRDKVRVRFGRRVRVRCRLRLGVDVDIGLELG